MPIHLLLAKIAAWGSLVAVFAALTVMALCVAYDGVTAAQAAATGQSAPDWSITFRGSMLFATAVFLCPWFWAGRIGVQYWWWSRLKRGGARRPLCDTPFTLHYVSVVVFEDMVVRKPCATYRELQEYANRLTSAHWLTQYPDALADTCRAAADYISRRRELDLLMRPEEGGL